MAKQHVSASPFHWLRSLAGTFGIGVARSQRRPQRRPTCKLHAEALEDRVVLSHGEVQYGFAHRVNKPSDIFSVVNDAGDDDVPATGIEVDMGWGTGGGSSSTWWARHEHHNLSTTVDLGDFFDRPTVKTADEWLQRLGQVLQDDSYDQTFAALWLDIKTPNDGDINLLVDSVRRHVPDNVWVVYDIQAIGNFGADSVGYQQLKGSLRPNEGLGVWIEDEDEVSQIHAKFKADQVTNSVVHHGHALNIDEDILEVINQSQYHQADDPYRFKKVFTWTNGLKSTMKEYIDPSNAYHTQGQIVGAPAVEWGSLLHADSGDLLDFANAVSESGKLRGHPQRQFL